MCRIGADTVVKCLTEYSTTTETVKLLRVEPKVIKEFPQ